MNILTPNLISNFTTGIMSTMPKSLSFHSSIEAINTRTQGIHNLMTSNITNLNEIGTKAFTSLHKWSNQLSSIPFLTEPLAQPTKTILTEATTSVTSIKESLLLTINEMTSFGSEMIVRAPIAGLIMGASWYISSRYTQGTIDKIGDIFDVSEEKENQVARLVKGGLIGIGGIFALEVLGVDVFNIVGNLGMAGIALGLIAKDLSAEISAGLQVKSKSSFKVGDKVKIGDKFTGIVEAITYLHTTLKIIDEGKEKRIVIPNTEIKNKAVIIDKDHDGSIPDLDASEKLKFITSIGITEAEFNKRCSFISSIEDFMLIEISGKPGRIGQITGITNTHLILNPINHFEAGEKLKVSDISNDKLYIPLAEVLKNDFRMLNTKEALEF